jgi:hypothetical protein
VQSCLVNVGGRYSTTEGHHFDSKEPQELVALQGCSIGGGCLTTSRLNRLALTAPHGVRRRRRRSRLGAPVWLQVIPCVAASDESAGCFVLAQQLAPVPTDPTSRLKRVAFVACDGTRPFVISFARPVEWIRWGGRVHASDGRYLPDLDSKLEREPVAIRRE